MAIDISKVKRTRNGSEVRIYATDGRKAYPIHGAILLTSGWEPKTWTRDGAFVVQLQSHDWDLIEEPRTVEIDVWLSVYPGGIVNCWRTKNHADTHSDSSRIACINITRTVTEGEGL